MAELEGLNRTFMELKQRSVMRYVISWLFESHLYGIETALSPKTNVTCWLFESHLYGIETR